MASSVVKCIFNLYIKTLRTDKFEVRVHYVDLGDSQVVHGKSSFRAEYFFFQFNVKKCED